MPTLRDELFLAIDEIDAQIIRTQAGSAKILQELQSKKAALIEANRLLSKELNDLLSAIRPAPKR